ncbi:MAG: DNA polymerase III subunit alpha [Phycisphaerae bacterium]
MPSKPDITPLHVRSGYSLLRGTMHIERLIARSVELGHSHVAMTDVNGLYGATAFWKQAVNAGLTPLLGAELHRPGESPLVALVDSDTGYENLCHIITRLHAANEDEAAPAGSAASVSRGRKASNAHNAASADSGVPTAVLSADGRDSPAELLATLCDGLQFLLADAGFARRALRAGIPPDRLHLAVDPACQTRTQLVTLADAAETLGIPLAASAAGPTASPADADAARLLAAIRLRTTVDRVSPGQLPHPRAHLRSSDTLARQLAEFPAAVTGNARLVEQCGRFALLPREPVFPRFETPDGSEPVAFLRSLCRQGLARRYGPSPSDAVLARLDRELRLIERMGFVGYFLVVWDIVQYARRRGAPVAGRGSGASSIVAYLLGITNVCPIRYDIPFERFLHEGREDFPDLDVDFCWRLRDEVIDYAFDRWGRDCTAMVSMHTTFQPRSAFRETAKAVGYSDDQITRMMRDEGRTDAVDQAEIGRLGRMSRSIAGLPHVLSVHPGGIVIAPRGIDRYVPIQRAAKGVMISQMDKDGVEDLRLVKLDLLGNRNLSTIRYACDLIRNRTGEAPDIEALPPDDAATVALLQSARTVGCNQLESPAMRHLLTMMQPSDAGDVMKILALIRPGAASIGMKEVFVRRRRGLEPVPPAPPQAAGLLRDTCGVMLYEDDVMLLAAAMLACSLPEADRFRKAVQKCRSDQQRLELSRRFLAGCRNNGIDLDYAKSIWVQMAKFNAYSFCRAHAGSYAILAYAGAYLRAHWPLESWTAALNNNQSMYHPRLYVEQAKREGVRFRRPCVNRSEEEFAIEDGEIRVGLNFVEGLGPVTIERILEVRRGRPFDGLTDFLTRTRLPEAEARALILCGALDFTGRSRPTLMMELNLYRTMKPGNVPGASLLSAAPVIPNAPGDYSEARKYFDERGVLGVSLREHIMQLYRPTLRRLTDCDSRHLRGRVGQQVRIAGMLEARRTTGTQTGETMMFLSLDDEYGLFEVTVFPGVLRTSRERVDRSGPYWVEGRVESQHGCITVTADRIEQVHVELSPEHD